MPLGARESVSRAGRWYVHYSVVIMINEGQLVMHYDIPRENSIPRKHPPKFDRKHFVLLSLLIFCFILDGAIELSDLSVAWRSCYCAVMSRFPLFLPFSYLLSTVSPAISNYLFPWGFELADFNCTSSHPQSLVITTGYKKLGHYVRRVVRCSE